MPRGRPPKLIILNPEELNALDEDFQAHRTLISCSKCKDFGSLRPNDTSTSNLPMPTFHCTSCGTSFNHRELRTMLTPAINHALSSFDPILGSQVSTATQAVTAVPQMNPPLVFDQHADLPDILKTIFNELNTQRQYLAEHETWSKKCMTMQSELTAANNRIAELEEANAHLRSKMTQTSQGSLPVPDQDHFPRLPISTQLSNGSAWPQTRSAARPTLSTAIQQRRQQTAARAFQLPSTTHGFQYLYLPARARIPTGQMRARLRKLGIDNSRVLDLHYPTSQVVALLIHNDFLETIQTALDKFGISPLTNFDPCDPTHLKDPKYSDLPSDERAHLAYQHHCDRMTRAIEFIRAPVKFAVARDFELKGWISPEQLQVFLTNRQTGQGNQLASAANFFRPSSPGDHHMDNSEDLASSATTDTPSISTDLL